MKRPLWYVLMYGVRTYMYMYMYLTLLNVERLGIVIHKYVGMITD